jgi:Uma2 family endonuclease
MSATLELPVKGKPKLPTTLVNGDRLTQKEFHELYEQMPSDFRAELIGGIVYVSSPVKHPHAENQLPLGTLFTLYEAATPGVRAADNASVFLSNDTEPQPDLHLRLLPDVGGSVEITPDGYLSGPPEFVCEISDSSRSLDLNAKKKQYATCGVLEYLVLNLRDETIHWFDLAVDRELTADSDGVIRIATFPGLWIHVSAVIDRDLQSMLKTLQSGLASPEHAAFVKKLAAAKKA